MSRFLGWKEGPLCMPYIYVTELSFQAHILAFNFIFMLTLLFTTLSTSHHFTVIVITMLSVSFVKLWNCPAWLRSLQKYTAKYSACLSLLWSLNLRRQKM